MGGVQSSIRRTTSGSPLIHSFKLLHSTEGEREGGIKREGEEERERIMGGGEKRRK